jgi:hypothetical protein
MGAFIDVGNLGQVETDPREFSSPSDEFSPTKQRERCSARFATGSDGYCTKLLLWKMVSLCRAVSKISEGLENGNIKWPY